MRFLVLSLICTTGVKPSGAQTWIYGQLMDGRYPVFDADAIADLKVEQISISILNKPSSRPIRDDGHRVIFHFNERGMIISFLTVRPGRYGSSDTLHREYFYTGDDLQAKSERVGRYRKFTIFNKVNDSLIYETTRVKRGAMEWQEISNEQVLTTTKDKGRVRWISSYRGGKDAAPYQHTVSSYEDGKLISRELWVGPTLFQSEKWYYTASVLSSYEYHNIENNRFMVQYFDDDTSGQTDFKWCEHQLCRTWSIVYHENGLPKGFILMDPESQDMEIWEFRYDYR